MRKIILMIVLVSLLSMTMTGCFGNFTLVRKVYEFNASIENPFVRQILFWVMNIIPVYGFAGWIDVCILNLLEFWTGTNPLAMNENESETQRFVRDGVEYDVTATKNRFDFTEVTNRENTFAVVFNTEDNSWNIHRDGQEFKITQEVGEELKLFNFDGEVLASVANF